MIIELTDCIRVLSGVIETAFGSPPITKDITEGYTRPGTYLYPTKINCDDNGVLRHDEYDFELVRFAAKSYEGYSELLSFQDTIRDLFSRPIPIPDAFSLYPEELSFELFVQEMYLVASFHLENLQVPDESDTPPVIEELEYMGQVVAEE